MERFFLIIVVSLLLFSCSTIKEKKNDRDNYDLKGNVKSLKEVSYVAVDRFGEIKKGEIPSSPDTYSETAHYKVQFNKKGNEEFKLEYHPNGMMFFRQDFRYNDRDLKVESSALFTLINDTNEYRIAYRYNEAGKLIESNIYYLDGKLERKKVYEYNEEAKWKGVQSFNSTKERISESAYFYNEDETLEHKIETYYRTSLSKEYKNIKSIFKYDEKGWMIMKTINTLIRTSSSSEHKQFETWMFRYEEFDNNGNWTIRIDSKDEFPMYLVERIIEYW